jgi:hypothetical protein
MVGVSELIKETKTWRVENEEDAIELINEWKENAIEKQYTVKKSGYVIKQKKSKGQVVDEYFLVSVEVSYEI